MQETPPTRVVAAFDFDCTITQSDTFLPFLIFMEGRLKAYWKLFTLTPSFVMWLLGRLSRDATKERILTAFFGGMNIETLRKKGQLFARTYLPTVVTPQGLARVRWHQQQGHRCILVSASLDVYLQPWAENAQFDNLICSQLTIDGTNKITGNLSEGNCWGPEKARRLQRLLGPKKDYILYVYGDSRGDHELLALADHKFYCTMP